MTPPQLEMLIAEWIEASTQKPVILSERSESKDLRIY